MGDISDELDAYSLWLYEELIADGVPEAEALRRSHEAASNWIPGMGEWGLGEQDSVAERAARSSPQWRKTREAVIAREQEAQRRQKPLCQDCGIRLGRQVHHRSHQPVDERSLDHLLLLCGRCHLARHGRG